MENKQKNPRRRLNSLILLVAFTAIMLIISTYAWFSAQKNVTIGGLKGTVNVAEGLEISLDASNWSQEVDFSKYTAEQLKTMYERMDAPTGTGAAAYYSRADGKGTSQIEGTLSADAPEHNIVPSELLPVSTSGLAKASLAEGAAAGDGIGEKDVNFYRGINENGDDLKNIITVLKTSALDATSTYTESNGETLTASHHDYPGYYAIDLFLRNSSSTTESGTANRSEILQLNSNSLLKLNNQASTSTGLQNTVRVAFAIYNANATAATDGADTNTTVDGEEWTAQLPDMATSNYMTAAQQQILNAYKDQTIADVAIWEPNASDHVQYVVNNNNNNLNTDTTSTAKHTYSTADLAAFPMTEGTSTHAGVYAFGTSTPMRTYALTNKSVGATLDAIYDWATPEDTLKPQVTLQTEKTAADDFKISGGVKNLVSVTSPEAAKYTRGDETDVANFKMANGSVCKVRMFVWLEGQDVDTINYASHGGGVYLDVGLLKDGTVGS